MYVRDRGLGQWLALATAVLSTAGTAAQGGLFSGKVHQSPWGFVYDDYPQKIWEAEKAIAEATGAPVPPMYARTGGTQYQASMQAIVPKYVPGSEQQIASYDRRLNEPGGAYETTYGKQLEILRGLVNAQKTGQPFYATPATVAANVPAQLPTAAKPASGQSLPPTGVSPLATPPSQYPLTDGRGNIVDAQGRILQRAQPGMLQAGMFPDLGSAAPFVFGGVGLLILLLSQGDKKKR